MTVVAEQGFERSVPVTGYSFLDILSSPFLCQYPQGFLSLD